MFGKIVKKLTHRINGENAQTAREFFFFSPSFLYRKKAPPSDFIQIKIDSEG